MPIVHRLLALIAVLLVCRLSPVARGAQDYVDLMRWGRQQQFVPHLNGPSGELLLSNRWARLFFRADSKRVELDGGLISLSFPIHANGGTLLVSQFDLDKTLRPLLRPPRLPEGKKIQTIAIGAGHGGKDPGKQTGKRVEKDYTLKLALELEEQLKAAGLKVVMIRRTDEFIDLLDRPAIARKKAADLFVSLHYNAFTGPGAETAKGVETYCLTPAGASSTNDVEGNGGMPRMPANKFDSENVFLAWQLQRAIVGQTDLDDRGIKRARYLELTQMAMPAVLIEGGFMTHADDASMIWDADSRAKLAEAITEGILRYKRIVEREKP